MDEARSPALPLDVDAALRARASVRSYLAPPVDPATLRAVFDAARWSPSNCNSQPWLVKVLSGPARDRMSAVLLADFAAKRMSMDYPFDRSLFTGACQERMLQQNAKLGLARERVQNDADAARRTVEGNVRFFGAPHAAFFFLPSWSNERQAADLGMFAQSVMLSFISHGIGTCPQTSLGMFAETVRRELGVGPEYKLMFGMAIGYPNTSDPMCRIDQGRAPLSEVVEFRES